MRAVGPEPCGRRHESERGRPSCVRSPRDARRASPTRAACSELVVVAEHPGRQPAETPDGQRGDAGEQGDLPQHPRQAGPASVPHCLTRGAGCEQAALGAGAEAGALQALLQHLQVRHEGRRWRERLLEPWAQVDGGPVVLRTAVAFRPEVHEGGEGALQLVRDGLGAAPVHQGVGYGRTYVEHGGPEHHGEEGEEHRQRANARDASHRHGVAQPLLGKDAAHRAGASCSSLQAAVEREAGTVAHEVQQRAESQRGGPQGIRWEIAEPEPRVYVIPEDQAQHQRADQSAKARESNEDLYADVARLLALESDCQGAGHAPHQRGNDHVIWNPRVCTSATQRGSDNSLSDP
mmetsp:Transcript_100122/g.272162  ORF Transcript_100122/g.272162 Transcript_100122/m.272162 type:complete len:349 (-) Transcript_100122:18-1064(-)